MYLFCNLAISFLGLYPTAGIYNIIDKFCIHYAKQKKPGKLFHLYIVLELAKWNYGTIY